MSELHIAAALICSRTSKSRSMIFSSIPLDTLLGVLLLGLICGVVGCFAVLNKQGLLGDGISHASLPGIALMFILIESKSTPMLLLGAAGAALLAMLTILNITKYTRIKFDTALAIVLSVFYGLGIVLKSSIQGSGNAKQAGLDSYILGQVTFILREDIIMMSLCAVVVLVIVLVYWKQLSLFIFDVDYARSLGYSSKCFNIVLSLLITLAVVIGLKTVGVILMCAMLISPAVAARQWTNKLPMMLVLSSLFGMLAGFVGTYVGSSFERVPTGPMIVVSISVIVLLSLLFAPQRGILSKLIQRKKNKIEFNNNRNKDDDHP